MILPSALNASECRSSSGGYCLDLTNLAGAGYAAEAATPDAGDLIAKLYTFGLMLIGISALIMFVAGGVIYLTAGDNQKMVTQAQTYMRNSVLGLVLALLSYLILYTLNPDLVTRGFPEIDPLTPAGGTSATQPAPVGTQVPRTSKCQNGLGCDPAYVCAQGIGRSGAPLYYCAEPATGCRQAGGRPGCPQGQVCIHDGVFAEPTCVSSAD